MSRPRKERIFAHEQNTGACQIPRDRSVGGDYIPQFVSFRGAGKGEWGARSQAGHRAAEKCPKQKSELNESGHAEKS